MYHLWKRLRNLDQKKTKTKTLFLRCKILFASHPYRWLHTQHTHTHTDKHTYTHTSLIWGVGWGLRGKGGGEHNEKVTFTRTADEINITTGTVQVLPPGHTDFTVIWSRFARICMHSYVQCVLWCKSRLINSAPGITACLKCSRPYNNCAFQLRVDSNNAPFEKHTWALLCCLIKTSSACLPTPLHVARLKTMTRAKLITPFRSGHGNFVDNYETTRQWRKYM